MTKLWVPESEWVCKKLGRGMMLLIMSGTFNFCAFFCRCPGRPIVSIRCSCWRSPIHQWYQRYAAERKQDGDTGNPSTATFKTRRAGMYFFISCIIYLLILTKIKVCCCFIQSLYIAIIAVCVDLMLLFF